MTTKTLLKIELAIDERWAVGTWPRSTDTVQLPVLLDPRQSRMLPYLPGTSLAGSLRRHLPPDMAQTWLGPEAGPREQRTGSIDRKPGKLLILGCLPIDAAVHDRGSTAINGARGAAQLNTQRREQWADPASVTLVAEHDGVRDENLMQQLSTWRPVIGRARTRGMGRARVTAHTSLTLDLTRTEQLTWWLTTRDTWLRGSTGCPEGATLVHVPVDSPTTSDATVQWRLKVVDPIHIGTGTRAEDHNRDGYSSAIPMSSNGTLTIPGSSWKGVFRHRAEVILNACGIAGGDRDAVVAMWFGSLERRGRLRFADSPTDVTKGKSRTHVAIDRFTGGARTSALFRVTSIPEETIVTLSIDADEALPPSVRNLLEHIVNDLHQGIIGIGGHTTRGYGTVQLTKGTPAPKPINVGELVAASGIATKEEAK